MGSRQIGQQEANAPLSLAKEQEDSIRVKASGDGSGGGWLLLAASPRAFPLLSCISKLWLLVFVLSVLVGVLGAMFTPSFALTSSLFTSRYLYPSSRIPVPLLEQVLVEVVLESLLGRDGWWPSHRSVEIAGIPTADSVGFCKRLVGLRELLVAIRATVMAAALGVSVVCSKESFCRLVSSPFVAS